MALDPKVIAHSHIWVLVEYVKMPCIGPDGTVWWGWFRVERCSECGEYRKIKG